MTKTQLVGVLELASKYRYGLTSRGIPLYLFCPYDETAPQFIVGSNHRNLSVNQIAMVEVPFPYETPPAPAKPRGNLVHLIGPVGVFEYERTALIYHYFPARAIASIPHPSGVTDIIDRDISRVEISEVTGWHTFHVDPPGCRDIDDAIAFHPDTGRWAITIADVASAVPVGDKVDIRARILGATFYDPDGSVGLPMLPSTLSEDSASLLPGQRRRGVSLIWKPATAEEFLRLSDTEEPVFVSSWINVKHSFTYESFAESTFARETLGVYCEGTASASAALAAGASPLPCVRQLDLVPSGQIPMARQLDLSASASSSQLPCVRQLDLVPSGQLPLDSHDWIAALMIRYNTAAARVLKKRGEGVLRIQSPAAAEKVAAWPPSLRHLASEAAVYVSATATDSGHAGLSLDAYTHASSPLRRYADLINQRILVGISSASMVDIDHLNQRAKANKRCSRDMTFLTHVTPGCVHEVDVVWIKEADCSERGQADGHKEADCSERGQSDGPKEADHSERGQADGHKEADCSERGQWKVWVPAWQRTLRLRHKPTAPGEPGTAGRIAVYCDPTRRNWKQRILTSDISIPLSLVTEVPLPCGSSTNPSEVLEHPSEL
jgi:hypothetical protein